MAMFDALPGIHVLKVERADHDEHRQSGVQYETSCECYPSQFSNLSLEYWRHLAPQHQMSRVHRTATASLSYPELVVFPGCSIERTLTNMGNRSVLGERTTSAHAQIALATQWRKVEEENLASAHGGKTRCTRFCGFNLVNDS